MQKRRRMDLPAPWESSSTCLCDQLAGVQRRRFGRLSHDLAVVYCGSVWTTAPSWLHSDDKNYATQAVERCCGELRSLSLPRRQNFHYQLAGSKSILISCCHRVPVYWATRVHAWVGACVRARALRDLGHIRPTAGARHFSPPTSPCTAVCGGSLQTFAER